MDIDTGITQEVLTIKSEIKLIDIFNRIIEKKSQACVDYIDKLNINPHLYLTFHLIKNTYSTLPL